MVNPVKTINDAFFAERSAVNPDTGCVEWSRGVNVGGYGTLKHRQKHHMAHRLVWEHKNGPIPDGLNVCHKCDNRKCINPEHLFLGTTQDNVDDKMQKGRFVALPGMKCGTAKLSDAQVTKIRTDVRSQRDIAVDYGISQTSVSDIKNRKTWAHLNDDVPDDKSINIKEFAALFGLPYMPLKNRLHSRQMPMSRALNLTAQQIGSPLRIQGVTL